MNIPIPRSLVGFLIVLLLSGAALAADLEDGLVAYYPFNGNAADESGNGNDGVLHGATLTLIPDRFGTPNSAYRFLADTDYISVSSPDIALLGTSFTITAWFRVDHQANEHRDFIRRGNHANYQLAIVDDTTRFGYTAHPPPNYPPNYCTGTLNVPIDEWTMITGIYDRDQGITRLYINDQLDTFNPDAVDPYNPGGEMEIGNWFGTRNAWNYPAFIGDIDDVRVYHRALTEEEIQLLFNPDADGDGILDDEDLCPETTIPESSVPTQELGVGRWALMDDDGVFDTTPPPGKGKGPGLGFTLEDTAGCSCEQIIAALGLGQGHVKFGCSNSAMIDWIELLPQCSPAPADMVCWWPFDEPAGPLAHDVVGANDGLHVNAPVPVDGMVGLALELDGLDQYVSALEVVPHDPRELTLALWVHPDQLGDCFPTMSCRTLVDYGTVAGLSVYTLGLDSQGEVVFYPCDDAFCYAYHTIGAGVPVQDWTHIALTANPLSGEVAFYVDGSPVPKSGTDWNPTTFDLYPLPRSWTIGDFQSGGLPLDGRIDELQLFERALTAGEIESIYEAGAEGLCRGEGEVTLCHVPVEDPAGAYDITVREFLVPVHLEHGDYTGACGGADAPFLSEGTIGSGKTELSAEGGDPAQAAKPATSRRVRRADTDRRRSRPN